MKKLLSILIFVVVACTRVYAAESKIIITAQVNPSNVATVKVGDNSSTTSITGEAESGKFLLLKWDAKLKVTLSNINSDYYFTGWTSETMPGKGTGYNAANTSWEYTLARSLGITETHTVKANFLPYWDIAAGSMFAYEDENNNLIVVAADVIFSLYGANTITPSLSSGTLDASYFLVSDLKNNTDGTKTVTISYTGTGLSLEDVKNKTVKLTLTGDNNKSKTVEISIIETPSLTFKGTDKGTYEIPSLLSDWDGDDVTIPILNPKQLLNVPITLTNDIDDDYIFYGWSIQQDGDAQATMEYGDDIKKTFTKSATIEPVFIKNACGYMVMQNKGSESNPNLQQSSDKIYFDLHEALSDAAALYTSTGKRQFVVFENLATIFAKANITRRLVQPYSGNEGTLLSRDGGYTIQKGVTLLIPGSPDYKYVLGQPETDVYLQTESNAPKNTFYRKLTVADNTIIKVDYGASISVFSHLYTCYQSWGMMPINHGWIELGTNCEIQLGNPTSNTSASDGKAGLYALGYVTCKDMTNDKHDESYGKVIAYAGSEVYEPLQYTDWRGGTVGLDMVSKKQNKVFPLTQYYIQNIEAPLVFYSGAEEYVVASLDLGLYNPNLKGKYIGASDAYFCLGSGAIMTKYYDKEHDRQRYILKSASSARASVSFDQLTLPILGSITMSSSDFVMPITSNMDIEVYNVDVKTYYDMCMLAGSTLYVDKDAELTLAENSSFSSSFFVYDLDQATYNGTAYMGAKANYIHPLSYTPYGTHTTDGTKVYYKDGVADLAGTKYKRKFADLTDAFVDVNGKVIVGTNYNSSAGFYTTLGGATIKSLEKKGIVKFNSVSTKTATKQVTSKGEFVDFEVTQAVLTNDDDTKINTISSAGIVYRNVEGKWITTDWNVEDFLITMPTDSKESYVSYSVDDEVRESIHNTTFKATINGTGFYFVVNGVETTSADVVYDKSKDLGITVRYKAQDTHDVTNSATITFKNQRYTNISYSTSISATENYIPKFSISPTENSFSPVFVNSSKMTKRVPEFALQYDNTNVASLEKNDTYAERLELNIVSVTPADNPFAFEFVKGKDLLSNASLSFTPPATAGDYQATFVVKLTYTDKNGIKAESEAATFTASASAIALGGNTLELTDECIEALNNMCVNVPVELEFKGKTKNANTLEIDIINNGDLSSPILTLSGDGTNLKPYKVLANAIPTTMPTIKVTQAIDWEYGIDGAEISCTPLIQRCEPSVQWNWSEMYFDGDYDEPIITNSNGKCTLTLMSITKKDGTEVEPMTSVMTYDQNLMKAHVEKNLQDEYEAIFAFEQQAGDWHSEYSNVFKANIYSDPSLLPLCVTSERIFTAVNHTSAGEVNYDPITSSVYFAPSATWTMTFKGIPDVLSFTPTKNTQLLIEESSNGSSYGTVFYAAITKGTNYQVELSPSTRLVKFTVVDATSLSSLCLTELNRVRMAPQMLYLPISNNPINNPTERTIKVIYVNRSPDPLQILSSLSSISVTPYELTPTAEGEYREIEVVVSSAATVQQDAYLSVEHEVGGHAQVDIETFVFPQKLPIQLENGKDEAKRFHFVTKEYKNTEWDAAEYAIKMQNITADPKNQPYVIFAFDGAPSFISFVPVIATNQADWKIDESEDGSVWSPCSDATKVDGVIKQELDFESRFVRVTYIGDNTNMVQMTHVNIMSDKDVIPNPTEINLTEINKYEGNMEVGENLTLALVNLTNLSISIDNTHFTLSYDDAIAPASQFVDLDNNKINGAFGEDVVSAIPFKVFWDASQAADFGTITFATKLEDETIQTLATVSLAATTSSIGSNQTLFTGVKPGYTLQQKVNDKDADKFSGIYAIIENDGIVHRPVDLSKTYDNNNKPLFDYLIIYGETTTTDGQTTIKLPTTTAGSNAKTPVYIYISDGEKYNFAFVEENANVANKVLGTISLAEGQELRVYITGFCPYASTGYTKEDEGVWHFQGKNGAKLHVYLDDCYIYSRHKTPEGRAFDGRHDGQAFSEPFVCGSGGVLVFENQDNKQIPSFDVSIHTRRNNMLKSNYGCFFELMKGMRAFQVSSPIQVRLTSADHKANSKTTLTFDDKWPTDASDPSKIERTNGYLSLQKQVNNAPSIDLGNANTIVNFKGGRVELQNAAVVSPNYKTTLAISFRSGLMAGFPMAYGIGTDDVGGEVNFYDGTTTVIPMEVDVKYRDYYLMDTETKVVDGVETLVQSTKTSCLRTPTKTFVYGGSHCMMRACEDVTSKGGAPTRNGKPLGIYKYPKTKPAGAARGGFGEPNAVGLVTPSGNAQGGVPDNYNVESVTPETNGTSNDNSDDYLNFWFTTEEESSVKPEVDKMINFWKACMTEISAEYMSYGGTIGGKTMMLPNQEVKNFLYCQIDENIHNVIYAGTGEGEDRNFTYQAPVKDPTSGQLDKPYLSIPPSYVGEEWQNYVETVEYIDPEHPENSIDTGDDYEITEKIYYIVPASADTWMTFTAPFNVQKLWVVETYDEKALEGFGTRSEILIEQARHNADFAAFFGVALALGRDQSFEEIYRDYLGWAMYKDNHKGNVNDYKNRGMVPLTHYKGDNFYTANYYLYKNNGPWTRNGDKFDTKWEVVGKVADNEILMRQGETYSMLFPYCTGCDVLTDEDGNIVKGENGLPIPSPVRDYWDYWSGKFLIFESTKATSENPHKIKGSKYHKELFDLANSVNEETAVLTGNSTFAKMFSDESVDKNIYTYIPEMGNEGFDNQSNDDGYGNVTYQTIEPTVAFLIADIQAPANMVAKRVSRSGNITYVNKNNTTTGSHTPTIGGGNSLFVTGIAGGINIAVAAPQMVQVVSATGNILYNGYVTDNVNVPLPINGIYVIKGENEVQKIFF